MNLIILASFLILMILVQIAIRRNTKIEEKEKSAFWEKEAKANSTRKKSLEGLDYITIPDEILHMSPKNMTADMQVCLDELLKLSTQKIVNLTGISNTDLKLAYGTANITILSEYDFHYTNLVTTLQTLAENLVDAGEIDLAIKVLEFAVDTGSDVSKTFFLLADLYQETGSPENVDLLIQQAEEIHSLMRDSILRTLKQNKRASGR